MTLAEACAHLDTPMPADWTEAERALNRLGRVLRIEELARQERQRLNRVIDAAGGIDPTRSNA